MSDPLKDLETKIRAATMPKTHWYVFNRDKSGYCMESDSSWDLQRWMNEQMASRPDYIAANGYHIVERTERTELQQLALDALVLLLARPGCCALHAAVAQECSDYATSLRSTYNIAKLEGREPKSFLRAAGLFEKASSALRATVVQQTQDAQYADRYRFLRDEADPDDGPFVMDGAGNDLGMGANLDVTVDAARASAGKTV